MNVRAVRKRPHSYDRIATGRKRELALAKRILYFVHMTAHECISFFAPFSLHENPVPESGNMDVDVLCMMAHRDDADIIAGGTLLRLKDQGYRFGIVDFSQGEMGTRGDARQRAGEAECAARILGADVRINLEFPDAHIENTVANRERVVRAIREFRPHLVITHGVKNRNPDHTHTGQLVRESCFTAGLVKYDTGQPPHRPNKIIYGMEYYESEPSFIIDITDQFERKMQAVSCYRSQVCGTCVDGPPTYISSDRFFREIEARMRFYGSKIHTDFAEAFYLETAMEVRDLVQEIGLRALIPGQGRNDKSEV